MRDVPPDLSALADVLDHALDLDGDARDAYLAALPSPTRDALGPLLRDALADDPLLDHPAAAFAALIDAGSAVGEGARVGPYCLDELVGEGGMGRVFRAHRADGAFRQTVALKVVRASLSLAGSDVAARLRRERDVLAALDHPGIARLLDGGETADGVPYLVTEFVDGAPITTWADAHALDVPARARLMIEVARAVDHAHRRLVVHRDLKPSNVLVTERDGVPRPVVLDFGIAKLLDAAEAEGTAGFPLTRTGLRMLTPAYAAPELFEPTATVTTAADVYGLGALLYEMLTGRRPYSDTGATGPPTVEATRPSRVVRAPPGATAGDETRARALRGDLDTICLKALHPDPARRYSSVAAFAADLSRHLDGRPVEARPDSLAYTAGRFARRHRAAVAAAVVAVASLVGGLGVSLVALRDEREARADAEAAVAQATEASDMLAGLFEMAQPDYDHGREVTVREAVAEGVRRAGAIESPVLRAYLLRVFAEAYINAGDPARADSLLQAALAIHGGARSDEATRVRMHLASTRDALADPVRALALARRVYRDHRADADPSTALSALVFMSRAYSSFGRHDTAVRLAEQAVARVEPDGSAAYKLEAYSLLGDARFGAGRVEASVAPYEAALRLSLQTYGRQDSHTTRVQFSLGRARGRLGDTEAAEAMIREALAFDAERYGAHLMCHPYAYLGEVQLSAGHFGEAVASLDSAIAMGIPLYGRTHPDIGAWRALQAQAHNGLGDYAAAEQAARDALAIADAHAPTSAAARDGALAQLSHALRGQGREAEARVSHR